MDRAGVQDSLERWKKSYVTAKESLCSRDHIPSLPSFELGLAISGLRRCGKTTLAIQLSKEFPNEQVLYYNFEDPLFLHASDPSGVELLYSVYEQSVGNAPKLMILDEIQNVDAWERWVRSAIDQRRCRVIVTGSNAKLLSAELATSLTGRCLEHISWPLSLSEVSKFLNINKETQSLNREYCLQHMLKWGALPAVILTEGEHFREMLLRQYLSDLIHKDIINRYSIRNKRAFDRLLIYYQTNISSLHSYSAIKKVFGIPIDTISEYTSALRDAFLVFEVERFHKNLKVQSRDPRKVYVADLGLRRISSRSPEADIGKLLENLVYLDLRRRNQSVYYYSEDGEVDFLVTENYQPKMAIQVCAYGMENSETRKRELSALVKCMKTCELDEGTIVTMDRSETIEIDGFVVNSVSAAKWLL